MYTHTYVCVGRNLYKLCRSKVKTIVHNSYKKVIDLMDFTSGIVIKSSLAENGFVKFNYKVIQNVLQQVKKFLTSCLAALGCM